MVRYVPKTVRERGRVHLAERLAEHGWQCFIARRSPNEDRGDRRSSRAGHGSAAQVSLPGEQPGSAFLQLRHAGLAVGISGHHHVHPPEAPVTYLLSRNDVSSGQLDDEFGGRVVAASGDVFRRPVPEAWHKLGA